ncbi:MAG TPA: hypothetical protein VFE20_00100 [Thermoleophilia bacterium]|nr:hypothetical protein [Thermoleophilia bacterium]
MAKTWTEETLEIMQSWADTQQKLWDSWFEAAGQTGQGEAFAGRDWFAQWQNATRKSLETWEELARQTMESQMGWAGNEQFSKMMESDSEEARKLHETWMDQTSTILTSFSEAQKKVWEAWIETATSMAGSETKSTEWFKTWQDMANESLGSWDDLIKRSMDSQKEWTRRWGSSAGSSTKASAAKADGEKKPADGEKKPGK